MITIKEIAELAGVSRGTVDRVLNDRGGVNSAVRERIIRIIEQYGYKPNKAARALVNRKRLHTIGIISASLENIFFKDVVEGIRQAEKEMKEFGISLAYMEVAKFSVPDQIRCIEEMMERRIDALAINPINDPAVKSALQKLQQGGTPIITFNSDIEDVEKLAYIGCDYRQTGRIAAGLIGFNNREPTTICIVTGSMKSLGHSLRVEGFRDEIKRYPHMEVVDVIEMFDDEITSYGKVRDLLERNRSVDAFFFAAGGKEGGIRAIREAMGGKNVRIVTMDLDLFTAECITNGVVCATVCQQPFAQGYEPVRQLANYLLYDEVPEKKYQYTQSEIRIVQSL